MAVILVRSDDPNKPKPKTKRVWDWRDHIPMLAAGFSILFIGIRLLSISGGNFETADAIMQASGTTTIMVGAFLPILGWIAFIPGAFIAAVLLDRSVELSPRPAAVLLMLLLLTVGILTTPISFAIGIGLWAIPLFLVACILAIVIFLLSRLFARRNLARFRKYFTFRSFLVACTYLLTWYSFFAIAFNPVPWVPSENISSPAQPPFTGYILGESDIDMTILTAHGQIVHIPPGKILSQKVCNEQVAYSGFNTNTLYRVLIKYSEPHYPECIENSQWPYFPGWLP